jgi:hypothetical protein
VKALSRILAVGALVPALPALAGGLYLKAKPVAERVAEGEAVVLEVRAVTTVPLALSASPEVLVESRDGEMAASALSCTPFEADANGSVELKASANRKGRCELKLGAGTHKLKLRYRLADGNVDSNTVKVQVGTATADARR